LYTFVALVGDVRSVVQQGLGLCLKEIVALRGRIFYTASRLEFCHGKERGGKSSDRIRGKISGGWALSASRSNCAPACAPERFQAPHVRSRNLLLPCQSSTWLLHTGFWKSTWTHNEL